MCRITRAAIDELLRFLPLFDVPRREFVRAVRGGTREEDGVIIGPFPEYHDDVIEFFMAAGKPCWSDFGYRPREASRMLRDDSLVSRCSLEEIRTMLTYCVRAERFGDGSWAALLESGRIVALLRRLEVLRAEVQ